jgi:hypothetical protein
LDLLDVPNAYTGAALKAVRVKGTEDGLEFFLIVGIPAGGTTGQVLGKASATDYDVSWITPAAAGVNSVTGDGVGGTPSNPVLTFPEPAEIGAEPAFTKGNIVAGANVSLTGSGVGRLVGAGDLVIASTGGGGGGGAYLTDLDTWPILKFDKNYRYVHTMAGAVAISSNLVSPAGVLGNFCKLYIKANGVNKPTFSPEFTVVWDNWLNSNGSWNRFLAENTPDGKILLQIEQASTGAGGGGVGATIITISFAANATISHIAAGTTELQIDPTGAEIGFRTLLYIKADGINKPFWSSGFVVTYDDYINVAGVWNRFWIEWRPENKAITHIINI